MLLQGWGKVDPRYDLIRPAIDNSNLYNRYNILSILYGVFLKKFPHLCPMGLFGIYVLKFHKQSLI